MVLKSPRLTVSEECIYSIHCGLFLFSVCVDGCVGEWEYAYVHACGCEKEDMERERDKKR